MSLTLHLGPEGEIPSDTKHCGKSFFNEILSPSYPDYFKLDEFLSVDEQALLEPQYMDPPQPRGAYRSTDPHELKAVFARVLEHLRTNCDRYPLVHTIWDDVNKRSGGGTSDVFQYKGCMCYLDGYHNEASHRQDLLVCGMDADEWVRAAPTVVLGGMIFHVDTQNKFEQYRDILKELIEKCDQAIRAGQRVLWLFSN
jgi:hypothetical protein